MNPAIIQLLLALAQVLPPLAAAIAAALQKSGEWTPEQAAAFRLRMEAALAADHWQPEVEP